MIFDAVKLLKVSDNSGLMMEELLLLQAIYDYQISMRNLDRVLIQELDQLYNKYFAKFSTKYDSGGTFEATNPWNNMLNKLIRDEWIVDHRLNKNVFNLSEFEVSDKFRDIFKGKQTDRELYELVKDIFPRQYVNNFNGDRLYNFKGNEQEDLIIFKNFQAKILSGDRTSKFNEFYYITSCLFEEGSEVSHLRWDRYVASFFENIKLYREQIS